MSKAVLLLLIQVIVLHTVHAQSDTAAEPQFLKVLSNFNLAGYGAMNYYNFDWGTDSVKRNAIDNERFVLEMGYHWNDRIRLNAEIEFEHGGTGSSVEFDRFEEFGEFEYDISKGGEVLLEQMNLAFNIGKRSELKVGRVKVPFGLMFQREEPTDYLTAVNSEMETQILPENWTENGFLFAGKLGGRNQWSYYLSLVNGLDGSAFNSANWIKRGNQRRFEMVNAENFAFIGRMDFQVFEGLQLGLSGYVSNTTDNRPKPDLKIATPIVLSEFHFQYNFKSLIINGMLFYGALSNSEALSNQNRNLSNNLNVKRTPVGASALGAFGEIALKVFGNQAIIRTFNKIDLTIYGRYDYYDTMLSTQGVIFNNPRWERQSITVGGVYKIIEDVHIKAQYTMRNVGAPAPTSIEGSTSERTFVCGFAFEF
ncbi:MAG: autotransporter outer membrane beta-barrel domain-containing protein [Saprospiraceae bacterium]